MLSLRHGSDLRDLVQTIDVPTCLFCLGIFAWPERADVASMCIAWPIDRASFHQTRMLVGSDKGLLLLYSPLDLARHILVGNLSE